jgi:hypothetical protein
MASVESLSWLQQAALSAQAVFYGVTVVGLLLTALFGVVKYRLFRSGRPFITITLEASSRPCSPELAQIGVIAKLDNGSRVLAKAEELEWECRALSLYSQEDVESKIEEYFSSTDEHTRAHPGTSEFPWNVQQRITKQNLNIEIEPNEYSHENVSFIVPKYCRAVQVRLFIPTKRNINRGWTAVIYHDTNHPDGEST